MNQRPKPGEDEDDLLNLQQQFFSSGGSQMSSVTVKRPDKRKTEVSHDPRDVVNMEGKVRSLTKLPKIVILSCHKLRINKKL